MTEEDVSFEAGSETLSGRLIRAGGPSQILFLHGAGRATKDRAQPIARYLAAHHDISSFAFDFSGHGQSSGQLAESSLEKRYQEARAAIAAAGFEGPFGVCAFSMAGHVAIELLNEHSIPCLALFYAAVYAREARHLAFGNPQFSELIRRERSWANSECFDTLQRFRGDLLTVIGENDEVIPRDVTDTIMASAANARSRTLVVVPGAPHLLLPNLLADEKLFGSICTSIAASLSAS